RLILASLSLTGSGFYTSCGGSTGVGVMDPNLGGIVEQGMRLNHFRCPILDPRTHVHTVL
ncbi:hypothetical protein KI387_026141, partial [Taxus chinensis]